MHDLVADIDRRTVLLERPLHDLDCTHDARTKAAGLRKIYFHGTFVTHAAPNSFCISVPARILAISAPWYHDRFGIRLSPRAGRALCQQTTGWKRRTAPGLGSATVL